MQLKHIKIYVILAVTAILSFMPFNNALGEKYSYALPEAASAQVEILDDDPEDTVAEPEPVTSAVAPAPPESITIVHGKFRKSFDMTSYRVKSKIFTHVEDGKKHGRTGAYADRRKSILRIRMFGYSDYDAIKFMFPGLIEDTEAFLTKYADTPARDAKLRFSPDSGVKFTVIKEKPGKLADRGHLYSDMMDGYIAGSRSTVRPVFIHAEAAVKTADVLRYTNFRADFSTSYAESGAPRKHNVAHALNKFNGMRVEPGQEVSFNKTVGPRSEANGFMEAKIILNGRYEEGIGGGVCQSSTTLYNSALLAGMTIVSARQHTLASGYIEPSFDAMVNASSSDLVFKNDTGGPVFIHTFFNQLTVGAAFYGEKMPYRILRKSEVLEVIPHEGYERIKDTGKYSEHVKYEGEFHIVNYPKDGLVSRGYLEYYDGGRLIKRKLIRQDKYKPAKGLIVEGAMKKIPEPLPEQRPPLPGGFIR